MIMNVNINLNAVELTKMQAQAGEGEKFFDIVLNELFNLLTENKELASDSSLMIMPYGIFSFMPLLAEQQNLTSLIAGNIDSKENLKSVLLELIQSGASATDVESFLQKLKDQNLQYNLPESKNYSEIINSIKSSHRDVDTLDIHKLIEKLTANGEDKGLTKSLLAETGKTVSKEENFKGMFSILKDAEMLNLREKAEEKSLKAEFTTTLGNSEISKNGNSDQKIQLPITRLQDISNIMFKALSASQKTLTIQLEPPEMGRILIKLFWENGAVRADMKVDYPHVKEMLTGLIPEIRSNLQSSGVKVSDFLLDLSREQRGYSDSYNGQGQRRYRGNQKFFEYIA